MQWAIFLPEIIALVSFLFKRLFPEEKLSKTLLGECLKHFGPSSLDAEVVAGLEMQLRDTLELDTLRKDFQSASLSAFAGEVLIWGLKGSSTFGIITVIAWLILLLFSSRLAVLMESGRTYKKLRNLYWIVFCASLLLSISMKLYRLKHP